jgi:hypothetical protein
MTKCCAAIVIIVCLASPLWAQPIDSNDPAADPANAQPTWENYKGTRLGFELKMIASHEHPRPSPAELGQLIARGLADGEVDSREGALMAIASGSGALMAPTPESFAKWEAYRETLLSFRKAVEALLYDQHEWVQSSALLALGALNMRPGEDRWIVDLDDEAVSTFVKRFHDDPRGHLRSEIVKLFWLCDCNDGILEARKQLFREAVYDTDPGVVQTAIRGAARLRMLDVLEFVVQRLNDPDRNTRLEAGTVLQDYGREAARYLPEINAALAREIDPDIRGILKAAVQIVSDP